MQEVLGVDIGGVIINHTSVDGEYPPLPHAFETLKDLREKRFGGNIFLVSHADHHLERKMYDWLVYRGFYYATGISLNQVKFCRKKSEKVGICEKLGVTHFIDDRREVLTHLNGAGIKNLFLFQGRIEEKDRFSSVLPFVMRVDSWKEISRRFLG